MDITTAIIIPIVESLTSPAKKHLGFLLSSTKYAKYIQAKVALLEGAAHDMLDVLDLIEPNNQLIPDRVPLWLEEVEKIKSLVGYGIPRGRFRFLNMKTMYTAGRKSFRILKEIDRLMMERNEINWTNVVIPLGMVHPPRPSTSAADFELLLTHPPQYLFCNLKALHMYNCVRLMYLFTKIMAESLRKLETLEVSSCPILTSVVNGENSEVEVITFHKLKVMVLHNLPELVSFCDNVHAIELPELVELKLDELPIITSVFPGNISSSKQQLFNKEVVIPNLDKLTISSMTNMKDIWPYESMSGEEEVNNIFMLRTIIVKDCNGIVNLFPSIPNRLSSNLERLRVEKCGSIEALFNIDTGRSEQLNGNSLRSIEVVECDSLVNLFPSNPMPLLNHLEELTIKECGSIEVLFNIDLSKTEQLNCNNTLRSIEVWNCESFREVWRIQDYENNYYGHLISGFQVVESIVVNSCSKFRNLVTPTTVDFDMRALKDVKIEWCEEYGERKNELVLNRQEQEINIMPKEVISKVDDNMSVVAFPSYKAKLIFHHLCNITLVGCQEVRVVFEIESPSNGDELLTSQRPLPLLPYLKDVHLERMETMTHVWKCNNWDEFFIVHKDQPQSSFQNLTTINLYDCNKIKYLLSPLMLKLFSGLKDVKIISCKSVEEVVSKRDDKDEEIMTTTFSPHLDVLQLYDLENLERIGGGVAKGKTNFSHDESKLSQVDVISWSLCQYATEIRISTCTILSSVIPSYAGGQMQRLEKLIIFNCSSMTEIFENIETDNNNINGCSSSSTGAIPRPATSTNSLPNLRVLKVEGCDRLENIFTLSTFQSLKKLEVLIIRDCKAMKVIVTQECEEHASEDVEVSCLKSIVLAGLPNLVGFFTGMDVHFQWPILEYVMINDCPQMTEFLSSNSTAPNLKFIHTEPGKDDLEYGLNFGAKFMWHTKPGASPDARTLGMLAMMERMSNGSSLSTSCTSLDAKSLAIVELMGQISNYSNLSTPSTSFDARSPGRNYFMDTLLSDCVLSTPSTSFGTRSSPGRNKLTDLIFSECGLSTGISEEMAGYIQDLIRSQVCMEEPL